MKMLIQLSNQKSIHLIPLLVVLNYIFNLTAARGQEFAILKGEEELWEQSVLYNELSGGIGGCRWNSST